MSLIKCPECGKQVSDKAIACPKCAYPFQNEEEITKTEIEIPINETNLEVLKTIKTISSVLSFSGPLLSLFLILNVHLDLFPFGYILIPISLLISLSSLIIFFIMKRKLKPYPKVTLSKKYILIISLSLLLLFIAFIIFGNFNFEGIFALFIFSIIFLVIYLIILVIQKIISSINESVSSQSVKMISYAIFTIIILLLLLNLHFFIGRLQIFTKKSMGFNNTFITQSDVDKIIKRYNKASYQEKLMIQDDPLCQRLFEEGIIIWKK